jgi:hypothetical protein
MKKSLAVLSLAACLAIGNASAFAAAPAVAPEAAPATVPATRPLTKTVGIHVVKRTENPDGSLTLLYRWDDKGTQRERSVIINSDTVIGISGKLSKISDLTDAALRDVSVATCGPDMVTAVSIRVGRAMIQISKDQLTAKQVANLEEAAPKPTAQSNASFENRAADLAAGLHLDSPEKEARIKALVLTDLLAVRDAHNAGFAPDKTVRGTFNAGLAKELTPTQIGALKDAITGNEIKRHWDAYHVIAPGLNAEEEAKIISVLREAREALLDVKNQDEHGRVMEPYKTQIEQYLTSKGHDGKALYKENSKKVGQPQTQPIPPVPAE